MFYCHCIRIRGSEIIACLLFARPFSDSPSLRPSVPPSCQMSVTLRSSSCPAPSRRPSPFLRSCHTVMAFLFFYFLFSLAERRRRCRDVRVCVGVEGPQAGLPTHPLPIPGCACVCNINTVDTQPVVYSSSKVNLFASIGLLTIHRRRCACCTGSSNNPPHYTRNVSSRISGEAHRHHHPRRN